MAIFERIVTVYNDKGSKQALKDLNKLEKSFANASKKIAKAFVGASVAAGAFALKVGKDSVKAAMEDQKAQRILALTLTKTVGAREEQIRAVEDFILQSSLATGVTDNELRPAFSRLIRSTNDVANAQSLLNLTLDISSATGKSVELIANSLGKAYDGNANALGRLGLGIDQSVLKTKDFNKIFGVLKKTFGGFAAQEADTLDGRLRRVGVAFDELKETIGFAILPVFEDLVAIVTNDILPAFRKFAEENSKQIAESFLNIGKFTINAAKGLGKMFQVISDNLPIFKLFTALLVGTFVGTKVAVGVGVLVGAIKLLTGAFKKQAVAGTAAGVATAFATGGVSAKAAAIGIGAFVAATGAALFAMNKLTEGIIDNTTAISNQSGVVVGHLKDLDRLSKATADVNLKNIKAGQILTNLNKKTAEQIASEKAIAALKKLGVKPTTEKDPIQLEAARLNLLKQANLEELRKVEALIKNAEAQMKVNDNAQRYADLLQVLSDQTISSEEVSVLASKWGVTTGQVLEYIARIYAASTTDLNDGPIVNLLMKWGLTKEEAEKYVDFTRALADEKIDDKEIEELMRKWGMSRQGVLDYAKTVQDGTALQAALSKGWALPGDEAAQSWRNALAALNAYLEALNSGKPRGIPSATPSGTPSTGGATTIPNPFNPASAALTTTAVEEQIATLTSLRESTEKGTAISFLLKEHIDTLSDSLTTSALGDLGDEQARMRAMGMFEGPGIGPTSAFDPGSFRQAENAGMTINLNVAGNLTTENDLLDTFRQKLLLEQQSGKPILYAGGL